MGADNVNTQGMSSLENLMLDLMAAEISTASTAPGTGGTWIQVGPGTADGVSRVWLNLDTLGTSSGNTRAYYTPAAKNFVAQTSPVQQVGQAGNTAPEGAPQMPDLIDMWGQPILAWKQDAVTQGQITQANQFAAASAPNAPSGQGARFYWRSNAAFLSSSALGRRGVDQRYSNDKGSMIGEGVAANQMAESLTAFLGHPSFPIRPATGNPTLPSQARGGIVLHSAGSDGVYLGKKDAGARQFDAGGPMLYARSFANSTGQLHTDKNGKTTTIDVVDDFDDEVIAVGN